MFWHISAKKEVCIYIIWPKVVSDISMDIPTFLSAIGISIGAGSINGNSTGTGHFVGCCCGTTPISTFACILDCSAWT